MAERTHHSLLYGSTLTSVHEYWKSHNFDYMDLCCKVMSLLFNALSSFVIAFLPRSKHPLISWLQSLSPVVLEPKKIKSVTVSAFSPSICHEMMGLDSIILFFWILSFKPVRELLWGSFQRACQQEALVPETLGGNSIKIYQNLLGWGEPRPGREHLQTLGGREELRQEGPPGYCEHPA